MRNSPVIPLTRLNHIPVMLNSDLIETIEATPDTVIRLTNGQKMVVRENAEEILEKVKSYRNAVTRGVDPGPELPLGEPSH
jgi:flagellar protein FlbD